MAEPESHGVPRSRARTVELRCPFCGSRNSAALWTLVDSDDAPRVAAICDGSLFVTMCRGCGEAISGDYSADFIDRSERLFIRYEAAGDLRPGAAWTAALSEDESAESYRLIRAPNQHALIELVHIWRERLDQARMLLVKHVLASKLADETGSHPTVCSFDHLDGQGRFVYVVIPADSEEPHLVEVSPETYQEFEPLVAPALPDLYAPGRWLDWNDRTAALLFRYVHTA